jgi:undecaprenyl-diphosphatase
VLHHRADVEELGMEWLEGLTSAPGPVAFGALALASLLEAGVVAAGADFLLILLIASRPNEWLAATAVATAASAIGSGLGFWLGRGLGRPLIRRVLPARSRRWIENHYRSHDVTAVGVGALLPFVPFKHISLTAGFFDLDFKRFILAASLTRGIRFVVIGYAASRYHREVWDALLQHGWAIVGAVLLAGAAVELTRRRVTAREAGS